MFDPCAHERSRPSRQRMVTHLTHHLEISLWREMCNVCRRRAKAGKATVTVLGCDGSSGSQSLGQICREVKRLP